VSIPQIPQEPTDQIAETFAFLQAEVKPNAQRIDSDVAALQKAIRAMAAAGLLGLRVPVDYGGKGLDEMDFRRFQEACARASGSLAFLQTQHQSACAMLARSDNEALKRAKLPGFAAGTSLSGIAFSQLRRKSAEPILRAVPAPGGFELYGSAPWLTGFGFFGECVTAATLPNGESLFLLHQLDGPGLELSEPMKLAAMEVVQTVSAQFDGFFVDAANVLYERPANWIENNDMINIALQSPFALGCARAGIDILEENFRRKGLEQIGQAATSLSAELAQCRTEAYAAMDERDNTERSLVARAWAIDLALRCAAAAVISSAGAGNSMEHPAQRVYREALVFSVSAQTGQIMEATLQRLIGSRNYS